MTKAHFIHGLDNGFLEACRIYVEICPHRTLFARLHELSRKELVIAITTTKLERTSALDETVLNLIDEESDTSTKKCFVVKYDSLMTP